MVSTLAMMAFGFAGCSAALSLNFYRKYRARLLVGGRAHAYARVADYKGTHLGLAFEYQGEDGRWHTVQAEVDEIYHYGPDYFLHGFLPADHKGHVFKWNRVANLRLREGGRSLGTVDALLGEAAGRETRTAFF